MEHKRLIHIKHISSPLHPVFAGVGLAFAPVLPEEERFVDTSKL